MIPTVLVIAALVAPNEPKPGLPVLPVGPQFVRPKPELPDLIKIPGPYLKIPCKVVRPSETVWVRLYVSDDRGRTWALEGEITPDKDSFVFCAKRPGEYWFAPCVKGKDGTLEPDELARLTPMQRALIETGTEPAAGPTITPPTVSPVRSKSVAREAEELDEELTRVELELIRKEIKRLSEAKELDPATEDKLDRFRIRLRDVRDRLDRNRNSAPSTLQSAPPTFALPPIPATPIDTLIPPMAIPTDPVIIPLPPRRPVAPMPRAPARR